MAVLFCSLASIAVAETGASRSIGAAVFLDKVRGGWAGQMIGVTYGAPTEFHSLQRINDDPRDWKPEELAGALDQDDLYVEMTFADVIDRVGIDATSDDYGAAFKSSKYQLFGKTIRRAHNVVLQQGGRVERDRLIVPLQRSAVPKLEQFDPGTVVERIGPDDPRWRFAGAWTKAGKTEEPSRVADSAGSEAVVTFRGTGAILTGVLRQEVGGTMSISTGARSAHWMAIRPTATATATVSGASSISWQATTNCAWL